MDNVK